jgi:hypothetical protein
MTTLYEQRATTKVKGWRVSSFFVFDSASDCIVLGKQKKRGYKVQTKAREVAITTKLHTHTHTHTRTHTHTHTHKYTHTHTHTHSQRHTQRHAHTNS